MGDTREQLTPKSDKAKGLLAKVRAMRGSKPQDTKAAAENFRDHLVNLTDSLESMLTQKRADLKAEKGQEVANTRKVGTLEKMVIHLESIVQLSDDYTEIK